MFKKLRQFVNNALDTVSKFVNRVKDAVFGRKSEPTARSRSSSASSKSSTSSVSATLSILRDSAKKIFSDPTKNAVDLANAELARFADIFPSQPIETKLEILDRVYVLLQEQPSSNASDLLRALISKALPEAQVFGFEYDNLILFKEKLEQVLERDEYQSQRQQVLQSELAWTSRCSAALHVHDTSGADAQQPAAWQPPSQVSVGMAF